MKISRLLPALFALGAVLLLIIAGVLLLGSDEDDDERRTIRLGVLLDKVDENDQGLNAIKFASEDLMALFPEEDRPFDLELEFLATNLDPSLARTQLESLVEDDIRVVIGLSSPEIEAARPIVNERGMVLISHCATASSLAIADDSVYRMVPTDADQGAELARVMFESGVRTVVPFYRGDVWGDDMSKSVRDAFVKLGGSFEQGVRFNPNAASNNEDLAMLSSRVDAARATAGDAVAVLYLGFWQESPRILEEASLHSILHDVEWYGGESSALSREILQNSAATRFASATGFVHPMLAESLTPRAQDVRDRIKAATTSDGIHYCAMTVYDAVWLAALSAAIAGTDDIAAFESVFQALANGYEGVSGRIEFDENGDRVGAEYDRWAIRSNGSGFTWTKIHSPHD